MQDLVKMLGEDGKRVIMDSEISPVSTWAERPLCTEEANTPKAT